MFVCFVCLQIDVLLLFNEFIYVFASVVKDFSNSFWSR